MVRSLMDAVKKGMSGYPIYSQEHVDDKLVIMKLFNAFGAGTWYIAEYDPNEERAFGYVTGFEGNEWGYISIPELADIKLHRTNVPMIEVDRYFTPVRFSTLDI